MRSRHMMERILSHPQPNALVVMIDKLRLWGTLSPADEAAILALPFTTRRLKQGDFITREGDTLKQSCLLLSGFVIRHKLTSEGGRQIFSLHMKGDVVDLHNALLRWSDHNVQALTVCEAAFIPVASIEKIVVDRPNVGKLLWYETLVDGSIFREWTLNVGRRDSRTRMAHMLCEFALRLQKAGLGDETDYELPMTHDELADVLGISNVHVSRVMKALSEEGCITRTKRAIRIDNWDRLRQLGDFDPRYLHYDGHPARA